jgi:His/Glu/Gln/Arg/opine family amino acid ABC transporter permease subunit
LDETKAGPTMYDLHFEALVPYAPLLMRGLGVTLYVSVAALIVGILSGLLLAFARLSRFRLFTVPAYLLIDFIRGVPLLVLLIFIYYGVSIFTGINIPAIGAAVGGLGIFYGAYMSEVFRAGILSVDKGQIEAAVALGMRRTRVFQRVTLPHAFRTVLPPITNSFISLVKDSSLVSVLAISDLTREGQEIVVATFRAFEAYTLIALIYYGITTVLSLFSTLLERRIRRGQ